MATVADYLGTDYTHSFDDNEKETTIPISRMGGARIKVDERAYDLLEEEFGLYDEEEASFPGAEIEEYFEGRDEVGFNHWVERKGIETDENDNPLFSDMLERQAGKCAEEAIVAHIMYNRELDGYRSHFVNGKVVHDNNQIGHHAFVVLEDLEGDEHALVDPDNTVSTGESELILNSEIRDVNEGGEIALGENWQNYVEGKGFRYSF